MCNSESTRQLRVLRSEGRTNRVNCTTGDLERTVSVVDDNSSGSSGDSGQYLHNRSVDVNREANHPTRD